MYHNDTPFEIRLATLTLSLSCAASTLTRIDHEFTSDQASAAATLRQMAAAYRMSQLVYVAARLGLADHLAHGARSATELGDVTTTRADALRRVLRGMAVIGLVEETRDGRFGPTALLDLLRADHPASVRNSVLFTAAAQNTFAWGSLEHTLRTGVSGFEHAFGQPRFDYLQQHPDWAGVFQSQMTLQMEQVARDVVSAYDFSKVAVVADIGGGHGTLLTAILRAHPDLHGILFDLPEVVSTAKELLHQAGVRDRCRLEPGDFFRAIPTDADIYVLSWILHDWPDDQAAKILDTCARGVAPGTPVLLIERLLPEHVDDSVASREALLGDVHMLAVLTGRERTRTEFDELLAACGFRLVRVIPTASPRAIIEAVRV